ncbi:FHA domain-containing protein [Streptomyces humi]|uniref:FHA domain-containing protein n=1 Tax=Streptomyces humi TaxID=1428620 RepID=UPI0006289488|nr:FHA domain-containing protein [Streptomyces humi]
MPTCPNGHQSGSDDWCEVCGHRMAGAVPPQPPPTAGGGYGFPPPAPGAPAGGPGGGPGGRHLSAVPNGSEAELCPQCRTPREGGAPFCEECRWNFLTNTATSYTPAAPRPPAPGAGAPTFRPPAPPSYGGNTDSYEYQGSRPSQMNRPAEPIPSFGSEPSGPTPFGGDRGGRPSGPPSPPAFGGDRGQSGPPPFGDDRGQSGPPPFGDDRGQSGPPPFGDDRGQSGPPPFGGDRGQSGPPAYGERGQSGPPPFGGDRGQSGPPPFGGERGPSAFGGGPGQNAGGPPPFGGAPGTGQASGPYTRDPAGGPAASPFGGDPSRPPVPQPGGPGATAGGAPGAYQQSAPPAPPGFPQETQRPPAGGPSFGGGDDDWVISPPTGGPGAPGARAGGYGYPQPGPTQAPPGPGFPQAPQGPATWTATIGPDREYFMAMMQRSGPEAAGLNLPAYSPEQQRTLTGNQVTIGRRRHSTGDTPDIDLSVPPEDPGVSHQHAVLVQQPDGSWAVVDQNSTNGTTVNGGEEPIQPFVPVPLQDGDRVHVGAWTTITVRRG